MTKTQKKRQNYFLSILGELIVASWFKGAIKVGKRCFDLRVPTHGFNLGSQKRIEVKSARKHNGGWQFDFSTRLQRRATFLCLLCFDENIRLKRVYWIDNSWGLPNHIWIGKNMEEWRLV